MLSYHPALDPYHSAFRMLRLLAFNPEKPIQREKLFIMDFYVAFPQLIGGIRLPPRETALKRRVTPVENEYVFTGTPQLVFLQMRALHDTALRLLSSTGLIDEEMYRADLARVNEKSVPVELKNRVYEVNAMEEKLMDFLVNVLGDLPLTGPNGLKSRTGLLEFRYDAA